MVYSWTAGIAALSSTQPEPRESESQRQWIMKDEATGDAQTHSPATFLWRSVWNLYLVPLFPLPSDKFLLPPFVLHHQEGLTLSTEPPLNTGDIILPSWSGLHTLTGTLFFPFCEQGKEILNASPACDP